MKTYVWCLCVALVAWIAGCKSEPNAPGMVDYGTGGTMTCIDRDGDGYGQNCIAGNDCDDTNVAVTSQCYVCVHDQPGCPCTVEGARTGCGKVTARLGDQTTCGYGETICSNGQWGECVLDGRSTRSFSDTRRSLGLAMATACAEVCDPYCKQFADTPDDSLSNRVGIIGTDGGITTDYLDGSAPIMPNGPMPANIKAQLTDAGLYPTAPPETIIYHELTPTSTAQDNVTGIAGVKTADVYFLDFSIGHNAGEAQRIWYDMDIVGGTIDQIRAGIPDLYMGVGRYEQYDRAGWNWSSPHATAVYTHLQSLTRNTDDVIDALNWAYFRYYDGGVVKPTSWVDALFAMATTGGLRGQNASSWWVQPRSSWVSPVSGASGPCPSGRVGFPCFRPTALPITVLFTQGPSNNGPGGQYAYARNSTYGLYGASQWPAATTAVTNNWTQATARSIDPITQFANYSGTTSPGTPNQNWGWYDPAECEFERGRASPNSFFKFHVTERTWYHFDTVGSAFNTVLYMYSAAGVGITCNDNHFAVNSDPIVSSIEGVVDPGDYYVVVDGQIGANGNYFLHVNAMPDAPAVTAPNYDETLTALRTLGTKIVSVDASGYTCRAGPTAFEQRNTGNQLEKLAIDTGSVNAAGVPYRVLMDASLGVCRTGDRRVDLQISDAILGTFNTATVGNSDVTAVAMDLDDAIDFDGPPGGSKILTPLNIDDATFVQSITTVPTLETNTYCQQTLANRFVGCKPGTTTTFSVTFKKPATVPMLTDRDQIFSFVIRTLRNGTLVLSETPVIIVVPAPRTTYYTDAWFVRDYDGSLACPKGTAPLWGFFGWNAQTPGDSHIDFEVAVAPSVAELPSAPVDVLRFSDPPGPTPLAGQAIHAQNPVDGPDTRAGVTIVDSTLALNERPRTSKAMRLRAHLVPTTDRRQNPVLELWNQRISCQPAE